MSLVEQREQWFPTSVQITVLQARSLRTKGKNGTNDAYAIMQVAKDKFSTSVVEKCVAPVWEEEATFDLPLFHHDNTERSTLHVYVMHRALVGPDKVLGQAIINLPELYENKTRDKTDWFKLLDKTGKPDKERGEVLLDIQFLRNNMTASMFDLSSQGKPRSRIGKLKDKLRGKKKEGLSDSASAIVTPTQGMMDSEGEEEEEVVAPAKEKKSTLKSLFGPKSKLQRNTSQSMSTLSSLPERDSALSSSLGSDLNVEPAEGKKMFKFLTHKRTGSSDGKLSQSATGHHAPVTICINGSHVYSKEGSLGSSGHGSTEDLQGTRGSREGVDVTALASKRQAEDQREREERERVRQEQERERVEEERRRMEREKEERERKEEEQRRNINEEKMRIEKEQRRKMEEEEKMRIEKEREQRRKMEEEKMRIKKEKEQRRKMEEEEKMRIEKEKEQRRKMEEEEEKMRIEKEKEQRRKMEEEMRIEKEKEQRRKMEEEEKMRIEKEQRRKMEEEKMRIEKEKEQRRKMEEEEKMRMEKEQRRKMEEKEKEQRRKMEEEEKMRIEKEKEQRRKMEEEEKERKRVEEEKRKLRLAEEEEKNRLEAERLRKEEQRKIEMERRLAEEKKEEERRAEEKEKLKKEEEKRACEEEKRMKVERKRREEEEKKIREEQKKENERQRLEEERNWKERETREKLKKQEMKECESKGGCEESKPVPRSRLTKARSGLTPGGTQAQNPFEVMASNPTEEMLSKNAPSTNPFEEVLSEEAPSSSPFEEPLATAGPPRSARVTAVRPSTSVSGFVSQMPLTSANPFLDEYNSGNFSSAEGDARKTPKKGLAPLPPQNKTQVLTPAVPSRGFSSTQLEETNPQSSCREVSKYPAPLPPDRLKKTREDAPEGPMVQSTIVSSQGKENILEVPENHQLMDVASLSENSIKIYPDSSQTGKKQTNEVQVSTEHPVSTSGQSQTTKANAKPFKYAGPAKHNKGPAPAKPSGSEDEPSHYSASQTVDTLHCEKQPSDSLNFNSNENPSNQKPLRGENYIVPNKAKNVLHAGESSSSVCAGESVQNDLGNNFPGSKGKHLEKMAVPYSVNQNVPSHVDWHVDQCSGVCETDRFADMESIASERESLTLASRKKAWAPVPPAKPKRVGDPGLLNQQPSLPATLSEADHGSAPGTHTHTRWPGPAVGEAPSSTPSPTASCSSRYTPPARVSLVKPCVGMSAGRHSESGLKPVPWARVVFPDGQPELGPSSAGGGGGRVGTATASAGRAHAVKPLSPVDRQPDYREAHEPRAEGSADLVQPKAKASEASRKGPYDQLTHAELAAMVMRQQDQLSQRDARIQELEQYIDNLLVRVMEEKPSILMTLALQKKAV